MTHATNPDTPTPPPAPRRQVVHHHLRTPLVALGASCATLLGAQALTNAGDLNPPTGAVAPTMSSLEEIKGKLDLIVGGATVVPRYWEVASLGGLNENAYEKTPDNWFKVVPDGDGTLEAVFLNISWSQFIAVRDGTGKLLLQLSGSTTDGTSMGYHRMNVRYSGGIQVSSRSPALNILYTPVQPAS